jgi:hypothetical protein
VFLAGCGKVDSEIDGAMTVRNRLLQAEGCQFLAKITADYGDTVYVFTLNCSVDNSGTLHFSVVAPDSISGITGTMSQAGGKLTFDDKALAFEPLADGQLSPVSAPWIMINTLRSGYIRTCADMENGHKFQIDDSYAEEALQLDIWTNRENVPYRCEILWQGRRYLTIDVESFKYL